MTFLAPLFLIGLGALAVPLLVHLTHRERRDPIRFPSLMFVRQIPFRTQRRQRIRHWLLFLLRAAGVALIALAFARPLLEGAGVGAAGGGAARDVVVLLDRSYSMQHGERWERAVAAIHRLIDGLAPEDHASLVLFSDRPEVAHQGSGDRSVLRAAVDRATPGPGVTRFGPALELARELLAQSQLPRREALLVSDLQRSGWDGRDDLRLPPGTDLSIVDLSDDEVENAAIAEVLIDREDGRATVAARVVNPGDRPVSRRRVTVELDGQERGSESVDLPPGGSTVVRFAGLPAPERPARGRIRLSPDALRVDDVFHFVLAPVLPIRILIVEGPGMRSRESLYLRQALSLGRNPPFAFETRRSVPRAADLNGWDVVILHDAPASDAAAQGLRSFVTGGGGLLVSLGQRSGPAQLQTGFPELLAAGGGNVTDRLADRGAAMSVLAYDHPAFAPFRTPRSGDFSATRFFRYRRLTAGTAARVLARFDDGSLALADASLGSGRALLWTSDLGNVWNDFPLQPVFLPFVHRVVLYLADFREVPASYGVGSLLDLATVVPEAPTEEEIVVEAPSGERTSVGAGTARVQLREPGFYQLRGVEAAPGSGTVVAVNPNVAESDLTPLDAEELAGAVSAREARDTTARGVQPELTLAEMERRQGLWWYLLLAVLFLLAVETVVAARTPATAVTRPHRGT